ncbi:MAG TPA: hypothetical protein VGD94_17145 [Vicinamibacterales bacterium]
MQTSGSDRYVSLPSGLTLPLAAVRLVLDLEARGLTITRDGDHILIRPPGRLTEDDRTALRRWKAHVLALIDSLDAQQ